MVWNDYPGAQNYVPAPMWDDPVQGAGHNCTCIASMASLAWVDPIFINQNLTALTQAYFYQPARTPQLQTAKLWLNDAGQLVYARSKDTAANKELWPAFYEKAFAKSVQGIADANTNPVMDGPPQAWLNFSTTPLYKMTGWKNNGAYGATQTGVLAYFCTPIDANLHTAQTTCPGIAWTGGAAAHSYSILGLYQDAQGTWVILRDPLRDGAILPPKPKPAAGTVAFSQDVYVNGIGQGNVRNTQVSLAAGTFGMKITDFQTYFAAFGFVGQKF
jgi:hypothetical protein